MQDAYRQVLGADIGNVNGGGVVQVLNQKYHINDTLTVHPFGNMGCVVEVTGQQIKDAWRWLPVIIPRKAVGFLQVSGLKYTIKTSVPSSVTGR